MLKMNHDEAIPHLPVYGRPEFSSSIELEEAQLPENPMAPDSVYQIIRNELMMDAPAGLNLATFCNEDYSDPWGERVVMESMKKNFIDHTEYPGTNLCESRSIKMLARELGTTFDREDGFYGSATIGSSEAIMLGLIAHKFTWSTRHRVLLDHGETWGIQVDPRDRPVVLMGSQMHGCWDKFCRYYDAVPLYVSIPGEPFSIQDGDTFTQILKTAIDDPDSPYAASIRETMGYTRSQPGRLIGDLVMCVGAVVGSTFTGNADNISSIDDAVDQFCQTRQEELPRGLQDQFNQAYQNYYKKRYPEVISKQTAPEAPNISDIPIHVDAASAGFVLLFSDSGSKLPFSFKDCPKRVASINISNHKFGMTFTGMGSVIFKNSRVVDPSLIYDIAYLGGHFVDYTVNFSRGSSMIVMQYYNFLRFGRQGYRSIMNNCLKNTQWFLDQLQADPSLSPILKNVSNQGHQNDVILPIIALTWNGEQHRSWSLHDLSEELRRNGWTVPSYPIPMDTPEDTKGIEVLRIVVQQVVSQEKLSLLLKNMREAVSDLEQHNINHRPPHPMKKNRRTC